MAEEKKEASTATPETPSLTPGKISDTKTVETVGPPAGPAKAPPAGFDFQGTMMMILPMIIIFYFLMIRPEKKRREALLALLSAVKKNDKVVLAGTGIYGTVADIDGDDVMLIIDPKKDVRIKVRKDAIAGVVSPEVKESEKTK